MPLEFTFICPLPNSIHARPANNLEEVATQFESSVTVLNERNGNEADAKSVLSLVGADIKQGDSCKVTIQGKDEQKAFTAIKSFIENVFPHCDEPLPELEVAEGEIVLPIMLRDKDIQFIRGTPASRGTGRGKAVVIGKLSLPNGIGSRPIAGSDTEWQTIQDALKSLKVGITTRLQEHLQLTEAAVLKAHLSIVRDPALSKKLRELIFKGKNISAADAIIGAYEHFAATLKNSESLYIRERVIDIQDVCSQLIKLIYGSVPDEELIHLSEPSVLVAENLTPSQFLTLERKHLRGLVLSHAGVTSHTVILARTFAIPTLTGITDVPMLINSGQNVIVDADVGILLAQINPEVEHYYKLEKKKNSRRKQKLEQLSKTEAKTNDGKKLEVAANISLPEEAESAFAHHAEGIGLFRTEMLFMDRRDSAPTEEEQYQAYLRVVKAAKKRPVIIRTLDIGGDKPIPYLSIPTENNPFLGYRAIRFYSDFPDLIKAQLRAIIRVSSHGNVKIMVPMVSCLDEIKTVKGMIREIQADFKKDNVPYDPDMQIGIMVEIPSVAFAIDQLSTEVDFFSIGTNDLAQYFLAVDRENKKVSHLYSFLTPSFIRLLKKIVDDAHKHGKWVGMCGEMAGALSNLPLLVGLGLDEISLGAPNIPEMKHALTQMDSKECQKLVASAMACSSKDEVSKLLNDFPLAGKDIPLLDTELIIIDSESSFKHEVIKELCDNLYITGRTNNPAGVEEDVWKREEVYATDMGYGFAIPHCMTNHIVSNSIAVLKPAAPIDWGKHEDTVEVVILLTIRESEAQYDHMKIFAKLARKVMHEDFREYIASENDPSAIKQFLEKNLEI